MTGNRKLQVSQQKATPVRYLTLLLLMTLSSAHVLSEDASWNQWRGPSRDGFWPGMLPEDLSRLELAWEKRLGPSYSGPVTDGKTIFTSETVDKTFERITALDLATGEVRWTRQWEGAITVPGYAMANGSWIKSTPVLAEGSLVILGMRDEVVCLEPDTGGIRWKADPAERFNARRPPFGGVCSPLIDGGSVYVMAGGATVKLSLADGSTLWKTLDDEGDEDDALGCPVIETITGTRQLVVPTRTRLCGVDLVDGSLLWSVRIEAYRNMNILTPTVIGDRIYTAARGGRSQCFEISKRGDDYVATESWNQNTQAYMSSPVTDGETIFVHNSNERLTALDADDGKVLWTGKPLGKYLSFVRNDRVLLALNSEGELMSVEPSRDSLNIWAKRKVADDSWAHLGVFDGGILVRDLNALKVYRYDSP